MSKHESGELLEVVHSNGEPTGEVLDKTTVHEQGLWHRDVHVWAVDGPRFLQQQRKWTKSLMRGEWDISVGGHVGLGESYLDAAVRETGEEIGLKVRRRDLRAIGQLAVELDVPGWEQPHRVVGENYALPAPGLSQRELALQAEEVEDARWYLIEQFAADLQNPETARLHAPQPMALYALGITGMRGIMGE